MSTTREGILFLAPVEPWARENGASVITADLLEGLSRTAQVEIFPVFMRKPPDGFTPRPPDRLRGILLDMEGRPRWASAARALFLASSPLRERFDNRAVARRVEETVREHGFRPTLVHVEHLPLVDIGIELSRKYRVPLVYRAHNIESALWARRLGLPAPLRDVVIRRMEKLEADAMRAADLSLCISEVDLEWARAYAPGAKSALFPCSLLMERYDAVEPAWTSEQPQICFVGGLEWAPNEVGLHWFVTRVLPLILAEMPDARLTVLARGAAERTWLADDPAIRILPAEAQAASLFASSDVSVAPLLQGGGVRIKIPESLALGCPVVATTIGSEGLELPGFTSTDDPAAFARACVMHLRERRGAGAREPMRSAVEARHGATVLARRLVELWQETHAAAHARRAGVPSAEGAILAAYSDVIPDNAPQEA